MTRPVATGTLQLVAEQGLLMTSAYLGTVLLARGLGPEAFGVYGVIISLLGWSQQAARSSLPLATTRLISQQSAEQALRVRETAFIPNLTLFLAVCLAVWAGAPLLASLFHVPDGGPLFRLAALDLPLYGMFVLYRGVAIGDRRFSLVAVAGATYGLAKLAGIAFLLLVGFSITTALIANLLASLAGLVLIASRIPIALARPDPALTRSLLGLALPLTLSSLGLTLLHHLDLWSLRLLQPEAMSSTIGIYVAAAYVAKAPELALIAVAPVVFPSLSRALADQDTVKALGYVQGAVRFLGVTLLPIAALVALDADNIMTLLFSDRYAGGGLLLRILIVGYAGLAFLVTLSIMLGAKGEFYLTVWIGFGAALLMLVLNLLLTPRYGAAGAASSLLLTSTIGSIFTGTLVYQRFGPLLPASTLMKMSLAALLMIVVGMQLPATPFLALPKCLGLLGLYLLILALSAELTRRDLQPLLFWR